MATYVFDKKTGKVVLEHRRTDRDKPKGAYIAQQFPDGIRHPQLASSPWDNSPASKFYSFKDLDQKAAALGMAGNTTRDEGREAHQGKAPTWNREKK